jgi:DNA-binding NtrC family response regulator
VTKRQKENNEEGTGIPQNDAGTCLKILLCCKTKNDDNTPNTFKRTLSVLVDGVIRKWSAEMTPKDECSVAWKTVEGEDKGALLLVGTPAEILEKLQEPGDRLHACVALLPDNQWNESLNQLMQNPCANVLMVARGKDTQGNDMIQEEDILQFTGILKRLARDYLRASEGSCEEKQSKKIDWKCSVSNKGLGDNSFISFFSDPSMAKMGRELKTALLDVRRQIGGKPLTKVHSILLLGETGTGKSLAAQWIAQQLFPEEWARGTTSSPEDLPLFHFNAASLPKNMVDVELFGTKMGAYTGATADRDGLLVTHAGKVIFLDEIGEMELESQVRLLTYIDKGKIPRYGDDQIRRSFSVLVGATNRPLDRWAHMEDAPFRADLYHRFEHIVRIPPLKERKKDMRLLISLLLQDPQLNKLTGDGKHCIERISLNAIEYLENASYPGNFRSLRTRVRIAIAEARAEGASILCLRHLIRV